MVVAGQILQVRVRVRVRVRDTCAAAWLYYLHAPFFGGKLPDENGAAIDKRLGRWLVLGLGARPGDKRHGSCMQLGQRRNSSTRGPLAEISIPNRVCKDLCTVKSALVRAQLVQERGYRRARGPAPRRATSPRSHSALACSRAGRRGRKNIPHVVKKQKKLDSKATQPQADAGRAVPPRNTPNTQCGKQFS